jgi:phage portal protein BeeE
LQSYLANLATRGGVPWAVIKNKRAMQGTQAKDLQDAWVAAAATRNGAPAVLSGDLELDVLTISPKDMALLDLRIFDEQRIAAAFGVPPFLVGLPDGSSMTYSNVSQVFDFHWRATLRTMGGSFFSALSRWALPAGQRVECNPDRYVEPDFAARAAGYATMAGIVDPVTGEQAMTVAEIRARERFSPASDPDAALELTTVGAP